MATVTITIEDIKTDDELDGVSIVCGSEPDFPAAADGCTPAQLLGVMTSRYVQALIVKAKSEAQSC